MNFVYVLCPGPRITSVALLKTDLYILCWVQGPYHIKVLYKLWIIFSWCQGPCTLVSSGEVGKANVVGWPLIEQESIAGPNVRD